MSGIAPPPVTSNLVVFMCIPPDFSGQAPELSSSPYSGIHNACHRPTVHRYKPLRGGSSVRVSGKHPVLTSGDFRHSGIAHFVRPPADASVKGRDCIFAMSPCIHMSACRSNSVPSCRDDSALGPCGSCGMRLFGDRSHLPIKKSLSHIAISILRSVSEITYSADNHQNRGFSRMFLCIKHTIDRPSE